MAAVLLALHYICLIGVSLYAIFYGWNNIHGINGEIISSSTEVKKIGDITINNNYLQNICTIFNGCDVTKGENLCAKYIQNCYGSLRCCSDCHFKWITNLNISSLIDIITDNKPANYTTTVSVTFVDSYYHIIKIDTIISILLIIIYILVFILQTVHKKNNTTKTSIKDQNEQITSRTTNYCFQILHGVVATLFISIFLVSVGITTYNVLYFMTNLYPLLKCQPSFVIILTWIAVLLIHILDQIVHISHIIVNKINKYNRLCGVKCLLQYIISIANSLLILWWICIAIYFYGVYSNKWLITITKS